MIPPNVFGENFHSKKNKSFRRKRNRRIRGAHGGTIPKRYLFN